MSHKGLKMYNLWSSSFSDEDLKLNGIDRPNSVDINIISGRLHQQGFDDKKFLSLVEDFVQIQKKMLMFIKNADEQKKYESQDLVNDPENFKRFMALTSNKSLEYLLLSKAILEKKSEIFCVVERIKSIIKSAALTVEEKIKLKTSSSVQDKLVTFSILKNQFTVLQGKSSDTLVSDIISPYLNLILSHERQISLDDKESYSSKKSWESDKVKYFNLPKVKVEKNYKVIEEVKSLITKKGNSEIHNEIIGVLKTITLSVLTEEVKLTKIGESIMSAYLNIICSKIFNVSPNLKNGLITYDQSIKQFKSDMSKCIPNLQKDSDLECAVRVIISIFKDFRVSKSNYLFANLNELCKRNSRIKAALFEKSLSETIKKRLVRFRSLSGFSKYLVKDEHTYFNVKSLSADEQKEFKIIDNMIKGHDVNAYIRLREFNSKSNKIVKYDTFDKYLNSRKKSYLFIKDKIKLSATERSKISGQPNMEHLEEKVQDSKDYEAVIDPLPFQLAVEGLYFDAKAPYQCSEFLKFETSKTNKKNKVPVYELNDNFKNLVVKYACAVHNIDNSSEEDDSLEFTSSNQGLKSVQDIKLKLQSVIDRSSQILARRLIRLGYESISEN
jgi:hypothetical protein